MTEIFERLSRLVNRLEDNIIVVPISQPAKSELSTSFISSILTVAKPGMRISDG